MYIHCNLDQSPAAMDKSDKYATTNKELDDSHIACDEQTAPFILARQAGRSARYGNSNVVLPRFCF